MFKLVCKNFLKNWYYILFAVAFIVASVYLELKVPSYMSEITKILQEEGQIDVIAPLGIKMLVCALLASLASVCVNFCIANFGSNVAHRLRKEMYERVQAFSPNDFAKYAIPSLITRTTNDITHVQNFTSRGLQLCVKAPVMAIWAIGEIWSKSWQWTLATAVAVVIMLVMFTIILFVAVPKFKVIQKQTDQLNNVSRENLTGMRVVRAFNAENYEQKIFDKANTNLTKTGLFVERVMNITGPVMSFLMSSLTIVIYLIGTIIINNEGNPLAKLNLFSDMIVFSSYGMHVIMSFMMISIVFIMLPRATVSANRILEVLDTTPSIRDGKLDAKDIASQGEIEFRNVSFKYPGAEDYILHDISFVAKKGEKIAFIGPTGSGKTTIVNLITRFYDASSGEIFIDGENIKKFKLKDLYNRLGYVPQKAYLFSDTIKNNIAFGESLVEKTDANVQESLKIAEVDDFVNNMKHGLDADIVQAGHNVSGGQKQRLSIARAVARHPEILILDDCFSALDFKTDKAVRRNIEKFAKDITTIMVAQRIGTVQDADQIFVLENGAVVGHGTHDELMQNCELYKEIAKSQISQEDM